MKRIRLGRGVTGVVLIVLALLAVTAAEGHAQLLTTQPQQATSGPGGSDAVSTGMRTSRVGTGANVAYVFEPTNPKPASAPVTVIVHGYYEPFLSFTQEALIRQTVRKGSTVIYPRWQNTPYTPCQGAFNIENCVQSTAAGVRNGLDFLRADPTRVQPDSRGLTWFGLSFGGNLAAAVANRWEELGVPRPVAVLLDDPHDGGLLGPNEPTLPAQLTGLPSDTLFVCHSGMQGDISKPRTMDASCNAILPRLTTLPPENKNVVMVSGDDHGTAAISATHAQCAGNQRLLRLAFKVDAVDTRFCFRQLDSLRSCALDGVDCATAIGDTPEHRYMGTWSDGVPVIGLKIQTAAPIRPQPVPERQAQPPGVPF